MSQDRRVGIPADLYARLEALVEKSEFKSVEAYILFVLGELADEGKARETLTPEEQRDVEERLRGLGYIE
jgi:Arc/MetJ-type ribon-helix-helix transcriptional regulator